MSLRIPTPPASAADAARTAFQAAVGARAFRLPALRNATGPLELAHPHQVFNLGLDDLTAGRGLAAARPVGWRYLVHDGGNAVAAAETVPSGPGDSHVFSAFNEGGFVGSTAEAIRAAEQLPETQQGDFELRLLHVPALHVMALWLHTAKDGGGQEATPGDLLIPLAPSPVQTPAGRPAPAEALLQELTSSASAGAGDAGPDDTSGS